MREDLHLAGQHQGLDAREEAERPAARKRAQPPVARIARLLAPGRSNRPRTECCPRMEDAEARRDRPQPRGRGRAQRVLDRSQVAEHQHLEHVLPGREDSARTRGGLVDDPGFGPHRGGQRQKAGRLEQDQAVGDLQRPARLR